jgi:hypothetical protein
MSLLDRLLGRTKTEQATEVEAPPCPHTALVPRWDALEDMGNLEKASSFFCQGCERTFTPEEAKAYLG